ncbi:MAG: hypothetical protein ACM3SR_18185, partial [Ignavibacteriales bacterium]
LMAIVYNIHVIIREGSDGSFLIAFSLYLNTIFATEQFVKVANAATAFGALLLLIKIFLELPFHRGLNFLGGDNY